MFNALGQFLSTLIFPQRCKSCRKPGQAICSRCIKKIPLASRLSNRKLAVYDYGNFLARNTIRDLKYHRRSDGAKALAISAISYISEYLSDEIQNTSYEEFILVPIPEHSKKMTSRGFNQSALLAKWWAFELKGKVMPLLKKTVFTIPQARLNRTMRLKNVANSMEVEKIVDPDRIYLIIDDVTTTGATFDEGVRALKQSGAKKIFCIALAHGYK